MSRHLVEAEKDVADCPIIAVVGTGGARQLQVIGGGTPARLELCELALSE